MSPRKFPLIAFLAISSHASGTPVFAPIDITEGTGSVATQTSGAPGGGVASRGIDGNLGNFTHTNGNDPSPSWSVDLGRDETFNQIIVHNRGGGCCPERLADITVQVFDSAMTEIYNSGVLNVANALASPSALVVTTPMMITARAITVSRDPASTPNEGVLSIGELEIGSILDVVLPAGTDLTQAGIPTMSIAQAPNVGGSFPGGGVPGNAVDGNLINTNFTHTTSDVDIDHTWQVDFGEEMLLESVAILNRTNCCGERLRDITVSVLDAEGNEVIASALLNPDNALGFTGIDQDGLDVDLTALNGGVPARGQTVVITRTPSAAGPNVDDQSVLSMREVTVLGATATGSRPRFEITEITFDGAEVSLTWNSVPGATYTVLRSTGLETWTDEVVDEHPSGGTSTNYVDTDPGDVDQLFYHVVRESNPQN